MTKLPKGPLKVIHVNRRAINENEVRARATIGEPRRLVPPITVQTRTSKVEGFALRLKGEMRVRYDLTKFPPGYEFGTADIRLWFETNEAVEVADTFGEFDSTNEETSNG